MASLSFYDRHPPSTIRHPELQTASAVCVMKDPPEQRNKPLVIEKPKSRYEANHKQEDQFLVIALLHRHQSLPSVELYDTKAQALPITIVLYVLLGDPSLRACVASTIQDDGNGRVHSRASDSNNDSLVRSPWGSSLYDPSS